MNVRCTVEVPTRYKAKNWLNPANVEALAGAVCDALEVPRSAIRELQALLLAPMRGRRRVAIWAVEADVNELYLKPIPD